MIQQTGNTNSMVRRLRSLGVPVGYSRGNSFAFKRRDPNPKRNRCDKLNRIMRMLRDQD